MRFVLIFLLLLCGCHSESPPVASSACRETYLNYFKKDHLRYEIVFGYKDARPARLVGDRYERAYFIERLLKYGFKRATDQEDTFSYEMTGPDLRKKLIDLHIIGSSVGPDDDDNRESLFQKWKSARADGAFIEGLKKADLIFYYGHSRDGGGPDFSPPRLNSHLHVDYGSYLRERSGRKKMRIALSHSEVRHQIVGLYSCVSDRLFYQELKKAQPDAAFMLSDSLLYFSDALDGMFETLQGIIEMKCQSDFHPTGIREFGLFK